MIVFVKKDVIKSCSREQCYLLDKLKIYSAESRHYITFEDDQELNEWLSKDIDNGEYYKRSLQCHARAISKLAHGQLKITITTETENKWLESEAILTLQEAISVLDTPLYVIVENSNNDWHFLLKTLDRTSRERIKRYIDKNWIYPVHGGGSETVNQIEKHTKTSALKFRTICIYDSDRRHPDELNSDWSPIKPQVCQGYKTQTTANELMGSNHHMLKRRFIESYIPKNELMKCVNEYNTVTTDKIDAFFRLSSNGRWFYNMKEGFKGDDKAENAGRDKDLYLTVSQEDRQLLLTGFGKRIADIYSKSENNDFDWDEDARIEFKSFTPKIMNYL